MDVPPMAITALIGRYNGITIEARWRSTTNIALF
jgi:hypothetical protein